MSQKAAAAGLAVASGQSICTAVLVVLKGAILVRLAECAAVGSAVDHFDVVVQRSREEVARVKLVRGRTVGQVAAVWHQQRGLR